MSPLPVIADVYRCAVTLLGSGGQTATNVFHVGSGATTAIDVANAIDGDPDGHNPWQFCSALFESARIDVIKLDGTSAEVSKIAEHILGTQAGQVLFESSALIKLMTDLRGKEHRGRMFIGPLTEESVSAGVLGGSVVTGIAAAMGAWKSNLEDEIGGNLKVASYKLGTASNVTSTLTENVQRTQRRRLRRVTGR